MLAPAPSGLLAAVPALLVDALAGVRRADDAAGARAAAAGLAELDDAEEGVAPRLYRRFQCRITYIQGGR